jgi:hypothetical protein
MKSSTFPNRFGLWYNSLVKNCNHKGLGIFYLLSAFIFGISGTLISVLIRIELYSSGNRIISPENQNFYNISITLHGCFGKSCFSEFIDDGSNLKRLADRSIMSVSTLQELTSQSFSCLFSGHRNYIW